MLGGRRGGRAVAPRAEEAVLSVRFSIFDSFDLGDRPDAGTVLGERLDFAVAAEAAGIDHYHVTEHHGTPLSSVPRRTSSSPR